MDPKTIGNAEAGWDVLLSESSDEEEKDGAQKSMEVETSEPPKELETKVENNTSPIEDLLAY